MGLGFGVYKGLGFGVWDWGLGFSLGRSRVVGPLKKVPATYTQSYPTLNPKTQTCEPGSVRLGSGRASVGVEGT